MNFLSRITSNKTSALLLSSTNELNPIWKRIGDKLWNVPMNTTVKYRHEISCIDQAINDVTAIEKIPNVGIAYEELFNISTQIKSAVDTKFPDSNLSQVTSSRRDIFKIIDEELQKEINKCAVADVLALDETYTKDPKVVIANVPNEEYKTKLALLYRLHLTKNYFQSMEKAFQSNEIPEDSGYSFTASKFLDCLLLGTASERIQEHLLLYGPKANQEKLQLCFYSLYEPELATAVMFVKRYPFQLKKHKKLIPKLSGSYLLDKLELNTKVRCILAWSDPKYSGFKPLEDDFEMPMEDLVVGRNKYFKEGKQVGKAFLTHLKNTIEEKEESKRETKQTFKRGFIFLVITCFADYFVCTM